MRVCGRAEVSAPPSLARGPERARGHAVRSGGRVEPGRVASVPRTRFAPLSSRSLRVFLPGKFTVI